MLNEEKVVKPPRMPTPRNSRAASLPPLRASQPISSPMAKLPAMLIDSVHHGKPGPSRASMIWPIRWRQPAPIVPPTMTGKREFMAPALAGNDEEAKHVHRYASGGVGAATGGIADRKSTRLNSSH